MLRVVGLEMSFRAGESITFPDFTADAGEWVLIDGASGAGKSTLLGLIGGLLQPSKGQVDFDGFVVSQQSQWARDRWRSRYVGLVPQRFHLVADLTALQNIQLAQWAAGVAVDEPKARHLLELVGLAGRSSQLPGQLSVGQSARLSIARAIANQPRLMLLDEPTANLDIETAQQVIQLLERVRLDFGATMIVATHDGRVATCIPGKARVYRL